MWPDPSLIDSADEARRWLVGVGRLAAPIERLSAFAALWAQLERSPARPQAIAVSLEIADCVRPAFLAELDAVLERAELLMYPVPERERPALQAALQGLRRARDAWQALQSRLAADRASGEAAEAQPASVLPLVRALDAHARLLVTMMRLRLVIDDQAWRTLCALGETLRASSFLDTPMSDPVPLLGRETAPRALFIHPLLVRLALPAGRSAAEFRLLARLARRWSALVGFRFEDGPVALEDVRHGPALVFNDFPATLRLVTRRLQHRFQERCDALRSPDGAAAQRLPAGMSPDAACRLLEALEPLWCAPRIVQWLPDLPLGRRGLRLGLPGGEAARQGGVRPPVTPRGPVPGAYVYGHFDSGAHVRPGPSLRAPRDSLSAWADGAVAADWVSMAQGASVFETDQPVPGLVLGSLLMVTAPPGPAPAGRPPARMLGQVETLEQTLPEDPQLPVRRRIGIRVWPGVPTLVAVRKGDFVPFHDGLLLRSEPSAEAPSTLVLAPGLFAVPGLVTVRGPDGDQRVRLDEVLDEGRQHLRIRFSEAGFR